MRVVPALVVTVVELDGQEAGVYSWAAGLPQKYKEAIILMVANPRWDTDSNKQGGAE